MHLFFSIYRIVPTRLGTVFSQDKEKLDLHLQNELIDDGFSYQYQSEEGYRYVDVGFLCLRLFLETN